MDANMNKIQLRFKLSLSEFNLDVDLHLPLDGVTAIFGHSGSGKTTLLRCIAGLERAPIGRLVVDEEVWQDAHQWKPTHQRNIGYVFQEASLLPHLTVIGNLNYGRHRTSVTNKISLEQAIELLGIGHLLDRKPEHLSGGERSRVAIARALAVNPRILLMDEPLAALDLKRKHEILPYLERLHNELSVPILYVTHSPDEVARLADHLVIMEQGRTLASGELTDVLSRIESPIHLGEDAGVIIEAKITEVDRQWHLARVEFAGGSLWTKDQELPIGHKVRVRILARDVSLANLPPEQSSIQNILQGHIDTIANDPHPGLALFRVRVGNQLILSRLTKRAAYELNLTPAKSVWVQIKSFALME